MSDKTPITVARGDGIGPEIMAATLHVLQAAGASLDIEEIEIGESVYLKGHTSGIPTEAWDSLRRTRVFLKAPITTPQGGGYKSLNVTVRKMLGLYANVRPCIAYHPFVETKYPGMNLVVVRENEEDTYAGIEHQQTDEVIQCLKLISVPGCERICRYAFEYAQRHNRRKVTCFTKDNIMKMTDGLFHRTFEEVARDYPNMESEHWIVDIGAAKMADTPTAFDVIVMPNLYGDILSDVAAQIAGSVGLAGSANIGEGFAMFEAIHGSAPRRAGQNLANPSGLLHGAIMMLVHIDQPEVAARVHNAWLRTIEDGIHTYDIYTDTHSRQKVGTREFAEAVAARLGQQPQTLPPVQYAAAASRPDSAAPVYTRKPPRRKALVGVDVFLHERQLTPDEIGLKLQAVSDDKLSIATISNRGVKVWPGGFSETLCTDHWVCRFTQPSAQTTLTNRDVVDLLGRLYAAGLDFVKTELLFTFDDRPAYALGQGE